MDKPISDNHHISLILADKVKRFALFQTDSYDEIKHPTIGFVHILKVVVDMNSKISIEQLNIELPGSDVFAKVFCVAKP